MPKVVYPPKGGGPPKVVYGPVCFFRFAQPDTDREFHLFGDIHRLITRCTLVEHIRAQKPDLLCLEHSARSIATLPVAPPYEPWTRGMINRVGIAIRSRDRALDGIRTMLFDDRRDYGFPPKDDTVAEWRAFFQLLRPGTRFPVTKLLKGDGRVDRKKAMDASSHILVQDLVAMDAAMVRTVMRQKETRRVFVVCGIEHVVDIAHQLWIIGFRIVACNAEFQHRLPAFQKELDTLNYPKDIDAMHVMDDWIAANPNPPFVRVPV